METPANLTPPRFAQVMAKPATLDLTKISAGDAILIWTQNSFYRFLVTNATAKRGQLIRGGEPVSAEEVALIGIADKSGQRLDAQNASLSTGARMLFRVAEGTLAPQLMTSPITRLNLIKAADRRTDEFNCETWDDQGGFDPLPLDEEREEDGVDSVFLLAWD